MATSVKLNDETKAQLERLQAEIRLETGERVTQQELLARIVESTIQSKSELIDSFRPANVPVSADQRDAFHDGMVSTGVTTEEDEVDDIIYG